MNSTNDPAVSDAKDYQLSLFVAGHTQKSLRAVRNVTRLCEEHLRGAYQLEVIDLYQQPELAARHELIAAPTLIRTQPLPPRRMVGDMSNSARVLSGLGISGRG